MEVDKLVETVESTFLSRFQTGNSLVDTLMTGLVVFVVTYLIKKLQEISMKELLLSWFGTQEELPPQNKITVSYVKDEDKYTVVTSGARIIYTYTLTFHAILHKIKQLDCYHAKITELREISLIKGFEEEFNLDDSDEEEEEKEKHSTANLIVSQETPFKLADDVYGVVNITENGGSPNFDIIVHSTVLSMDGLRDLIEVWCDEYEKTITPDDQKRLRFFSYIGLRYEEYEEYKFESSKTFDNVFFPEKEDMKKRLDFFETNKDWYVERGIPHRMGLLFHGEPGCGKTSVIKAIANHTRRHIVSIPLNQIKTGKELLQIFYSNKINGKKIPLNKRLYILEDIDCNSLTDVVAERENKSDSDGDDTNKDDQTVLRSSVKIPNIDAKFDMETNRLTLANLLEVLDGVMEMEGRMIIITTNYPERLDKALIRPGRIDIKLKFSKCTSQTLINMYQHLFQTEIPEKFRKVLPEDAWTPAESMQAFFNHINDPAEGLAYLIKSKAKDSSNIGPLHFSCQNKTVEKLGTKRPKDFM